MGQLSAKQTFIRFPHVKDAAISQRTSKHSIFYAGLKIISAPDGQLLACVKRTMQIVSYITEHTLLYGNACKQLCFL